MRPLLQFVTLGLVGFGIGRWCIPDSAPIAMTRKESSVATPIPQTSTPIVKAAAPPEFPPDYPVHLRIQRFFNARDPLGSATRLLPMINALTAEDFRKIEAEGWSPTPSANGYDQEFQDAFNDALVNRWLEVDPDAAAAIFRLEEILQTRGRSGAGDLPKALARVRPELILGMLTADGPATRVDGWASVAFQELAKRDLVSARQFLQRTTRPDMRKRAAIGIAKGVAEIDPLSAVAHARELNNNEVYRAALESAGKMGPDVLRQVLDASDDRFSLDETAAAWMIRYPNLPWDRLAPDNETAAAGVDDGIWREARRLTTKECAEKITQLDQMPGPAASQARRAILNVWVRHDPQAAMEWAMTHPTDAAGPGNQLPSLGLSIWRRQDRSAAMEWWSRQPDSELRQRLGNLAAAFQAGEGDIEGALKLFQPVPGADTADAIASIASAQARQNPAAAAEWLGQLPSEADCGKAAEDVARQWIQRDAEAAAKWIESLPPGVRRDRAIQGYAQAAAIADPAASREWVNAINDPRLRAATALNVALVMLSQDRINAPAKIRAWLQELPGIDERHRAALIRVYTR